MDRLFISMFTGIFSNVPLESEPNGRGDTSKLLKFGIFLVLVFLLILLFTGSETVKLVNRKKMGVSEVSFLRVVISVLVFIVFGFIALEPLDIRFQSPYYYVGTTSAYITSLFFFSLAIFNFVFGISSKIKKMGSNIPNNYAGDSLFFSFLQNQFSRSTIRNFLEPVLFLILGIVCGFLGHELIGQTLGVCAVSYWIIFLIEAGFEYENERTKADEIYFANNVRTVSNNQGATEEFIVR